MMLSKVIEDFFPKGTSRALIKIEQDFGGFSDTRVLIVNGKIYLGGIEGKNNIIASRGGVCVSDVPDISRFKPLKMKIEGTTFIYDDDDAISICIDVSDEEQEDEILDYTLCFWRRYADVKRYVPSALQTKLHWRVILERA